MAKKMVKENSETLIVKLQVELVKMQKKLIENGEKVLIIFEGRDAAGKDSMIKRLIEHLSPRETRVVALGKPNPVESGDWYFQRYVCQLPHQGEIVIFNRSWYNRAGVETVMGFCTKAQQQLFMNQVNPFETMLVDSGITLIKYYLDISKEEQIARLKDRQTNPLKQLKMSPIDLFAQKKWQAYTKARDTMLLHTNHRSAPWTVIRANDKKLAHLNVMQDILSRVRYPNKNQRIIHSDPDVVKVWPANSQELPTLYC